MLNDKQNIIGQLKEHILFLQGFKTHTDQSLKISLGVIDASFPNEIFPLAGIHEFLTDSTENVPATNGFISHIISGLMKSKGLCIWIGASQKVFPIGLKSFGIEPDNIVFIHVQNQKERLWVMEEALKCEGLCAVVGELKDLGFTESRRFQLAVEQSKVTGFIIRNHSTNPTINACVSRWKISSLPSDTENNLPGVGFPRWNIALLKIRNGRPGIWQMEYSYGKLHPISTSVALRVAERRKAV